MGTLRIIAGELRGRRLRVPPGRAVRPTADRVREALFSILGGRLDGLRVLDAYAGTGALGIEAVSRGARETVLVEEDPRALEVLRRNVESLGIAAACTILRGHVETLVAGDRLRGPFDVVLADPPYGDRAGEPLLRAVGHPGFLQPDAIVVLERDAALLEAGPPPGLRRVRTVRYGRTALDLFRSAVVTAEDDLHA